MHNDMQRGAAAVEWVGMVVAVALLMAVLSAWLPSAVRPPERPPDVIGVVARPLAEVPSQIQRVGIGLSQMAAMSTSRESRGRRMWRWVEGQAGPAVELVRDMGASYATAYFEGLRRRLEELVGDPIGEFATIRVDEENLTDVLGRLARDIVSDQDGLRDYVLGHRGRSAREIAVGVAGDAGGLSADVTAEVAEYLVKRWLARGLLGRLGGRR